MTRTDWNTNGGARLKVWARDAVNCGMGQRIARLCLATVCCLLLTACPPDEEPVAYDLRPSQELGDRLRQDGFNVDDVWIYSFDERLDRDQNIGSLRGWDHGGYVVDGCIEISLVLQPTGQRIDNFDGPVCLADGERTFIVELEMTTLDDE